MIWKRLRQDRNCAPMNASANDASCCFLIRKVRRENFKGWATDFAFRSSPISTKVHFSMSASQCEGSDLRKQRAPLSSRISARLRPPTPPQTKPGSHDQGLPQSESNAAIPKEAVMPEAYCLTNRHRCQPLTKMVYRDQSHFRGFVL